MAYDFGSTSSTDSLFAPVVPSVNQFSMETMRDRNAKAEGWQVARDRPGYYVRNNAAGIPTYTAASYFGSAVPSASQQLFESADLDAGKLQAAEVEWRERMTGRMDDLTGGLGVDEITGARDESLQELSQFSEILQDQSQGVMDEFESREVKITEKMNSDIAQARASTATLTATAKAAFDRAIEGIDSMRGIVDNDVREFAENAMRRGAEAIAQAQDTSRTFRADSYNVLGNMAAAMSQSVRSQMKMISSGRDAQGNLLDPSAASAMRKELMADVALSTAGQMGQMQLSIAQHQSQLDLAVSGSFFEAGKLDIAAANTVLAGEELKLQGEQLALGASGQLQEALTKQLATDMGIAELRANIGLKLMEGGLAARALQSDIQKTMASVLGMKADIRQSGTLAAVQHDAQLRTFLAEMERALGPMNIVGTFSALAAILQFATAPGANNFSALTGFDGLFGGLFGMEA